MTGDTTISAIWSNRTYTLLFYTNYSGKNYLINSDFSEPLNPDEWSSRATDVATISVDTFEKYNGYNSLKIVNTSPGESGKDLSIRTTTQGNTYADGYVGDSRDFVLSFWAKSSQNGSKLYWRWGYEGDYRSVTLSTTWEKYSVPMPKEPDFGAFVHPYVDCAGTVWLNSIQIEDGTVPTDFSPEPNVDERRIEETYGGKVSLPPAPVREGYSFNGWYTQSSGGEIITETMDVRPGYFTVYAHWSVEQYHVTFDPNGGIGSMSASLVPYGETFQLPSCGFTAPNGKQFKSWNVDEREYASGETLTIAGNTTVRAMWEDSPLMGSRISTGAGQSISDGDYRIVTAVDTDMGLDISGDTYDVSDGWNVHIWHNLTLAYDVFHVSYVGEGFYRIVQRTTENAVTVLGDGVTSGCNIAIMQYTGADSQLWSIENAGDGWYYLKSRSSGYCMDVADSIAENGTNVQIWIPNGSNAQKWRFAQEAPLTYTVSFDANGGSGSMSSASVASGSSYTLPVCGFTPPTGKQFKAWSVNGAEYAPGASITVTGDTTVSAVWEVTTVASGTCGANGDNLSWSLENDGTLTISGSGAMAGYSEGSAPWYPYRNQITVLNVSSGVTTVGQAAFYSCENLMKVTLADSVTDVGYRAFHRCTQLNDLHLSEGLSSIGSLAFYDCTALEKVEFPAGLSSLGREAFVDCKSLKEATLPAGLREIVNPFGGCALTEIKVDPSNESFISVNGVLYSNDMTILYVYPSGRTATSFTVPESVSTIAVYAFASCISLETVRLPNSLQEIRDVAFYNCENLQSTELPASVNKLGGNPFVYCKSMQEIPVNEGNNSYVSYEGVLFTKDMRNLISYPIGSSREIYEIPGSVTGILENSFGLSQNLKALRVHGNLASIGNYAFFYCDNLNDLYYTGSQSQWEAVSVGTGSESTWSHLTVHYNSAWSVSVSFEPNGGSGNMSSVSVPNGETYKLPPCVFTAPNGKQFKAWSIDGEEKAPGESVAISGNTIVRAVWEDRIPDDGPQIVINDATVAPGAVFEVPVLLINNPGIAGFGLNVSYDSDYLELVDRKAGMNVVFSPSVTDYPFAISLGNTEDFVEANATIATLTFKVKDGIQSGTASISLAFRSGGIPYNAADQTIDNFALVNGMVTITNAIAGDANGDGDVTPRDATRILQYYNGWSVEINTAAADANGDDDITPRDATRVLQYYNGWDVKIGKAQNTSKGELFASADLFGENAQLMGDDSPQFVIEDMTISAGETFDVPVLLKNNPGVAGFGLEITYDQSKLELTGRKANMTVTLGQNITDCPYPISFGVSENYTEADSIVATLTFKAKDDFLSGATPITVSMRRGGEPYDEMDEFGLGFEYVSGAITMESEEHTHTLTHTAAKAATCSPRPARRKETLNTGRVRAAASCSRIPTARKKSR